MKPFHGLHPVLSDFLELPELVDVLALCDTWFSTVSEHQDDGTWVTSFVELHGTLPSGRRLILDVGVRPVEQGFNIVFDAGLYTRTVNNGWRVYDRTHTPVPLCRAPDEMVPAVVDWYARVWPDWKLR